MQAYISKTSQITVGCGSVISYLSYANGLGFHFLHVKGPQWENFPILVPLRKFLEQHEVGPGGFIAHPF
jgi:hypothetical protein